MIVTAAAIAGPEGSSRAAVNTAALAASSDAPWGCRPAIATPPDAITAMTPSFGASASPSATRVEPSVAAQNATSAASTQAPVPLVAGAGFPRAVPTATINTSVTASGRIRRRSRT